MSSLQPVFEVVYNSLSKNMNCSLIKPENMMLYVKYAMELAELTHLKGAEQKQLVIDLMHKIVTESELSAENESICLDFIESGTLSQTIDIIVDATKGRIAVNKPVALFKRILVCCLPFINRRATSA